MWSRGKKRIMSTSQTREINRYSFLLLMRSTVALVIRATVARISRAKISALVLNCSDVFVLSKYLTSFSVKELEIPPTKNSVLLYRSFPC